MAEPSVITVAGRTGGAGDAGGLQSRNCVATATGVRFVDGREQAYDTVILATGFRAALAYLGAHIQRDERGMPAMDGARAAGPFLALFRRNAL